MIALAVAMSVVALQGCAFLLGPMPFQRILRSGLDLDDEFDRLFLTGGGCPHDTVMRMYPKFSRAICVLAANELLKVIRKQREAGVPPKTYLLSKGGTCTEPAKRQLRCVVERVVTTIYCGPNSNPFIPADCVEPGRPQIDRRLLRVEIRDPGGEMHADFERYSMRPTEQRKEKQGRRLTPRMVGED